MEHPPSSARTSINPLAIRHAHPRDAMIVFDEGPHKYYIQFPGESKFTCEDTLSVTTLVHQYFPHFDGDKILTRMLQKPQHLLKAEYRGKTKEDILTMWRKNGEDASSKGTIMHAAIENVLNGVPNTPESESCEGFQQFEQFAKERAELISRAWRTEMYVFTDNDTRICGSIDALFVNYGDDKTNTLYLSIYDWKRSKEIKTYSTERGFGVCSDLMNVNFYHYALQLSTYQYILENYYGGWEYKGKRYEHIRIVDRYIIVCHPNTPGKRALRIALPNLKRHVQHMMCDRYTTLELPRYLDRLVSKDVTRVIYEYVIKMTTSEQRLSSPPAKKNRATPDEEVYKQQAPMKKRKL